MIEGKEDTYNRIELLDFIERYINMLNQMSIGLTTWPMVLWYLFAIALIISAIGFVRVVYFVSIGYAFSIVVMACATLYAFREDLSMLSTIQAIGLIVWGVRLGVYIVQREARPAYSRELKSVRERGAVPLWNQFLIWIGISLLYVCMFLPGWITLSMHSHSVNSGILIIQGVGVTMLVAGVIIEALADLQKSRFKAQFPTRFCDRGLYRWVRCPNYLAEIMVWVGSWICGFASYQGILQWVLSTIGLVCITLIMMGSTKRLERSQKERYGQTPEYQNYIRTVPVLIPFLPIYTLKNIRVYIE
jgi:steroid 5-alpha reductase family enzyme